MPLLKKREFKKAPLPSGLSNHEEVFHCVMTNEIFREYEEFCQRVILCNSMVWTCSFTGKSGLTYLEALESEKESQGMLKDFPTELRIPVLFLASKTQRSSFIEMADDIYLYMKDRYFIGENVEASFLDNKWKEAHVLQVIAPNQEKLLTMSTNGHTNDKQFYPPASLYSYEVEQLDAEDEDVSEVMIVNAQQIKRKLKLTRDKSKLFLRQYVTQNDSGIFIVKEKVLQNYGINKMRFEQIFDGPLPNFCVSKKMKKPKQESITQFLSNKNDMSAENTLNLLERMRKREEEYKQLKENQKQKKAEIKLAERIKQREENNKISALLKEWYTPKEDLELENHKKIPVPAPLHLKVPDQYLGDILSLLEFAHTFSKFTRTKSFFPNGFTIDVIERALTEKEIEGPLVSILQMLLSTIFNLQAEETYHCAIKVDISNTSEKVKDPTEDISYTEAINLATKASMCSVHYHGLSLSSLPITSLTTSEILRLHLLSSGVRVNDSGMKWRYQVRGGYLSEDDPGLDFRLRYPHILKALAVYNISELPIGDKLKLIHCLMNQILTYSDIRDFIEDNLDKSRQAKIDLKLLQISDRKQDQEYISSRVRISKEKDSDVFLVKLTRDHEKKKTQNSKQMKNLMKSSTKFQNLLGQDRAYRKYYKLMSLPGLLLNTEEDFPGVCLEESIKRIPQLVGADKSAVLAHIRKLQDELNNSSDKENMENKEQNETPKVNGVHTPPLVEDDDVSTLLMCNADPSSCVVHSINGKQDNWGFYYDDKQVDEIIESLNDRGVRESELKQVLQNDRDDLMTFISQTPLSKSDAQKPNETEDNDLRLRPRRSTKLKFENTNFGFPTDANSDEVLQSVLIDTILELEENIYSGNIGSLKVKNREVWREKVVEKNYEYITETFLSKKEDAVNKIKSEGNNSRPGTPDITKKKFVDPGHSLSIKHEISEEYDFNYVEFLSHTEEHRSAIRALAMALIHVAQGVEQQYLKKPLGHISLRSDSKNLKSDLMEKWEQSLLAASSYSQIFLHYSTLDKCILWARSAFLARCLVCKRKSDPESMILCDNCNKGQHLFCFRPKLTAIPEGNWYCKECQKEKDKQEKAVDLEPRPKKRRIFKEESDEEVHEEPINNHEEQAEDEQEQFEEEEEDEKMEQGGDDDNDSTQDESDKDLITSNTKNKKKTLLSDEEESYDTCNKCSKEGTLICCDYCPNMYHLECAEPPLRRVPRGEWLCHRCKEKKVKTSDSDSTSGGENLNARRSKRREFDNDCFLHNAPLQEVLADVLKQEYAWPFLRPVTKNEVPDYYDIITKPMDFGTIKYKLNMGEYKCDADLMEDAALVFENCNTYNSADDEVYQCGQKLFKYFVHKCHEYGLKVPNKMEKQLNGENGMPSEPKKLCVN
ncbi:hypothetical protein RN001_001682 [Aquatica leii]|uniref:Bromodomain adjacent to zinc finger domain protein 1A n=1 Tax=Aquatica leii TaxID=1421715 RepID=A0AAN7PNW3_9COLE|nr:hypothetical protein RN001_001682 [Aquatica leii]